MAAPASQHMELQDWAALLFMGAIWGSSFLFAHIAVDYIPPLTLAFLRISLACIPLCLVLVWQKIRFRLVYDHFGKLFVLGLLNTAIPFFLIFYSQKFIGPGLGGILNATVPIMIVPLAHFLTHDEKMTARKISGVLLGFFGVMLMIGMDALNGATNNVMAELIMLGASVSYALGGIFARRFKTIPPLITTTGQLLAVAPFLLPLSLIFDDSLNLPMPSLEIWGCIFSLAFLSTALAFVFFFRLLARVGATRASLVAYLIPVSAIILGVVFKNETFTLSDFAGMAMISLSLAIIDGRLMGKKPTKNVLNAENMHDATVTK
ncbi:MAG: DMT family transporter [Pseudomonadota bacterium]